MTPALIAYVFHAKVHSQRDRFLYQSSRLSVPEFRAANRDLLNKLAMEMKSEFAIDFGETGIGIAFERGIYNFLKAEGILSI